MSEQATSTYEDDLKTPLLLKCGDWVRSNDRVARVRACYCINGEVLADLALYNHAGDKVGRESPAMGGPTTFEPACSLQGWTRIEKPEFPIRLVWVDTPSQTPGQPGKRMAQWGSHKTLAFRSYLPSESVPKGGKAPKSDFDPELEAAARRMAAQELRDMARTAGVPALVERAEALEKEAAALAPKR